LVADLAHGRLWAEGIEAGREPPEYARLSEAWWANARTIYYTDDRTPACYSWLIGRTVVFCHRSLVWRKIDRFTTVEYRSVRLLTDQLLKVSPELHLELRSRYPEPCEPPNEDERRTYRTGLAGRPSGRHLVKTEMERRASRGELKHSLRAEAKELADWYAASHPQAPPIKDGAIRNSFADLYRKLIGQATTPLDHSAGGTKLF
jgi:hypothetical protein